VHLFIQLVCASADKPEQGEQTAESRPGTGRHDVGRIVQEARHRPVQVGGAAGHPQAARCSRRRPSAADQSEAGASSRRPRRRAAGDPAPAAVALAPAVRRSMSARFVTSLALMPFVTRRGRGGGGGGGRAGAGTGNCEDEFCLLYGDKAA
jgi:hypothetical protein